MCPVPNWVMVFWFVCASMQFFWSICGQIIQAHLIGSQHGPLNSICFYFFRLANRKEPNTSANASISSLPPKLCRFVFPNCCIIGNLLDAFLAKSLLKVLISFEYIPTWHIFLLLVKFCGSPKIKIKIKPGKLKKMP